MTKHRSKISIEEKSQLLELAISYYKNNKSATDMLNSIMVEMYSDADARNINSVSKSLEKAKVIYQPLGKIYPDYHSQFISRHKNTINSVSAAVLNNPIEDNKKTKIGNLNIYKKTISSSLKDEMNNTRAKLFNLYDSTTQERPCLVFSNDGTASGKSYNVIESFLRPINTSIQLVGHSNLLFTCPQKSQLDISPNHLKEARKKLVPVNCIFAQNDMADLESKHWANQEKLEDIFRGWVKELTSHEGFKGQGYKLSSSISRVISAKKQVAAAQFDELLDIASAEDMLKNTERNLRKVLSDIARFLYVKFVPDSNSVSNKKNFFISEFISNDRLLITAVQMVNHTFPFESSKYCPTIMLLTAHKLRTQIAVLKPSTRSKDGLAMETHYIEDIVGHKCFKPEVRQEIDKLGPITNKSLEEQREYLHKTRYSVTEDDYYLKESINFDIVIDEEHVTYPNFLKLGKHTILPSNDSISDILSILYRINMSALNHKDGFNENWGDSACEIIDNIKKLFSERCEISENCDFDSMVELFAHKLHSPNIARQEIEQIINITRNVFAMTNKSFYNENELKKLRILGIGAPGRYTGVRIYFQTDENDKNPSLFDLFQLILCVFYVISNATHLEEYFQIFELQRDAEQNRPMRLFFNKIKQSRIDINNLFERPTDKDMRVDHFFAYFLPKVVFSIQKLERLASKPSLFDEDIYVSFKIEVVESLPEDSLMRCLANTNNRAILLSATSGIRSAFNSSFNPELFRQFSTVNGEERVRLYQRNIDETETFNELRKYRGQCRNTEFRTHDETSFKSTVGEDLSSKISQYVDFIKQSDTTGNIARYSEHQHREVNVAIKHMLSASLNRKHTMILANSGNASIAIKEFAMSHQEECISILNEKNYKKGDTNSTYKVFEFKPFEQGAKLRVILFDAALNRKENVAVQLSLSDDDTKICFIAAHNSAGTGINIFKRYINEAINEDFERICLVNMGYWSSIKTKEDGFQHIFNAIYLYQKYACGNDNLLFNDVDLNFLEGRNFGSLINAHQLEQAFTLMQSLGRAERCDTNINTEVFLSEEIIQHMTLFFSFLEREQQSLFIGSLSLLNHNLYQLTKQYSHTKSFESPLERDEFKQSSMEASQMIESFFKDYINPRINDVRHGDTSAIALNEAVRDISCVTDFSGYIRKIKQIPEIKEKGLDASIDLFDVNNLINNKKVTICHGSGLNELTDISEGIALYQPMLSLLPDYDKVMNNINPSYNCQEILLRISKLRKAARVSSAIPNPALRPMLKGNVGEYIFQAILDVNDIEILPIEEVFKLAGKVAYELFDVFVLLDNELICIDVKKWVSYLDAKNKCDDLLHTSKRKCRQISENLKTHNIKARFIYANVDLNNNPLNLYSENSVDEPVHYFNCFVRDPIYKVKTFNKRKQYNPIDHFAINANLMKLLQGTK
jgi:hypothetical protein